MSADTHIAVDPQIMGGKPVVRGTRITVEYILEQLQAGHSVADLVEGHPRLSREGVEAALQYALEAVRAEQVMAAS